MKNFIQKLLELHVGLYFAKQHVKLIVVTGSVGKTSTKLATATVLQERFRVRVQEGNHNTHMSVPTALLGVPYPDNIKSPIAWLKVFIYMWIRIIRPKDVDVIVQELGTDMPGDIPYFGKYLKPDIAVITAVSPEHMEFFKTMDAVAQEELSVAAYSKLTIVNRDDINEDYAKYAQTTEIDTYGTSGVAEYRYIIEDAVPGQGFAGKFVAPEYGEVPAKLALVGEHNIRAAVAAGCVAAKLGMSREEVAKGLEKIVPAPGRMQILRGVEESTILDDTYNSSPLATAAALKTLYNFPAPQRIAILGSMNELGSTSATSHEQIGKLCDPNLLSHVVTIGEDAERFLAPVAIRRGCSVMSFSSPYEAGAYVHKVMEPHAVILAKGSQNLVFAEEAIKVLLHSTDDEKRLVRQSSAWMKKKQQQFFG